MDDDTQWYSVSALFLVICISGEEFNHFLSYSCHFPVFCPSENLRYFTVGTHAFCHLWNRVDEEGSAKLTFPVIRDVHQVPCSLQLLLALLPQSRSRIGYDLSITEGWRESKGHNCKVLLLSNPVCRLSVHRLCCAFISLLCWHSVTFCFPGISHHFCVSFSLM